MAGSRHENVPGDRERDDSTEERFSEPEDLEAATADDDTEGSAAEDYGLLFGFVVAAVTVGALFVGPFRLFEVVLGGDGLVPLRMRPGVTNEPFVATAGATLLVGLVAGFGFPLTDRRAGKETARRLLGLPIPAGDDYRSEIAIGLVLPAMGLFALLALLLLLVPVGESLLAGDVVAATVQFVIVAVLLGIALGASVVVIALFVVASVYFIVPSFVGVFLGAFVGELVAGPPEPEPTPETSRGDPTE